MTDDTDRRLAVALLILRITLGVFLLQWSLEKLFVPEAAAGVAKAFYGVSPSPTQTYTVGVAVLALAAALFAGAWRRWTYGLAFLVQFRVRSGHMAAAHQPIRRTRKHLFMAGVPVLAAFLVWYLLRSWDIYSLDSRRS